MGDPDRHIRRIAAIDMGTVTTRLLISDVSADRIIEVERSTDITHLGEGLLEGGRLTPEAMGRVEAVIARYARTITQLGVDDVVSVATAAARDADNSAEFLKMLAGYGIEPMIISGSREAYLSFRGATWGRIGEGLLVVDVGGGSTEVIYGHVEGVGRERRVDIDLSRSTDAGSRRVTDLFLHSDPPSEDELDAAREWIVEQLRPLFDTLPDTPRSSLALAGAATSLAAIMLELDPYDPEQVDGAVITGAQIADLLELLCSMDLPRRKEIVGLHPGRASVIIAGALILEMILALSGLDSFTVSESDILYGMLIDAYGESLSMPS